jgi:hypothetical protein
VPVFVLQFKGVPTVSTFHSPRELHQKQWNEQLESEMSIGDKKNAVCAMGES